MNNMPGALRIASYNILANGYIRRDWYPRTSPEVLQWENRGTALARRIEGLGADVLCLQEVEEEACALLEAHLAPDGYSRLYARKTGKPDGCATFYRADTVSLQTSRTVYYRDGVGAPSSGHLALLTIFELGVERIGIANTHLKWDRYDRPRMDHLGYREIKELLQDYVSVDHGLSGWIICGDFNASPGSAIVEELALHGFADAYRDREQNTSNSNGRAKRIDYLFHSPRLAVTPSRLPEIGDLTPLPSDQEPSDHLPVMATFVMPE